jgi:hypothetical protein
MGQPEWKLAHPMGDLGNVYVDTTGVYAPEMEYHDDDGEGGTLVYRFSVERVSLIPVDEDDPDGEKMCIPFGYAEREDDLPHALRQYREWYCDDLDAVARSAGRDSADDIREALASEALMTRVHAYMDIGGHFGYDNLDSYPERIPAAREDDDEEEVE